MASPLVIQGHSYSWGHIKLNMTSALGVPYEARGFTDLGWSESLSVEKGAGLGRNSAPTRRSLGSYEASDATLSGFESEVDSFLKYVASQGGGSYGGPEFTVIASFANLNEGAHTVKLKRCRIIGVSASYSVGNTLLKQDLTLSVMSIERDGLTLHEQGVF